jgi:hypothetical protein
MAYPKIRPIEAVFQVLQVSYSKPSFSGKKIYYIKGSKIPVFHSLWILNANRMSLFSGETVEN